MHRWVIACEISSPTNCSIKLCVGFSMRVFVPTDRGGFSRDIFATGFRQFACPGLAALQSAQFAGFTGGLTFSPSC